MLHVVSGDTHSPQGKRYAPFGAQLQNHMRTDIAGSDIIFGIDPHHMRRHEQIVGNTAETCRRSQIP